MDHPLDLGPGAQRIKSHAQELGVCRGRGALGSNVDIADVTNRVIHHIVGIPRQPSLIISNSPTRQAVGRNIFSDEGYRRLIVPVELLPPVADFLLKDFLELLGVDLGQSHRIHSVYCTGEIVGLRPARSTVHVSCWHGFLAAAL